MEESGRVEGGRGETETEGGGRRAVSEKISLDRRKLILIFHDEEISIKEEKIELFLLLILKCHN